MSPTRTKLDRARPYVRYDAVAEASAALVIRSYSSSFRVTSRLLARGLRRDVHNLYALVRLADEVVDAPRPRQGVAERREALDRLEVETVRAIGSGASTNLVVHAFALTARRVGIDTALTGPFFASMRTDLDLDRHDDATLATYIHGSAEVVGLMCLRVFLAGEDDRQARYDEMATGARRLGAAFQKVNFLRDFGVDSTDLGRRYLTGLDPDELDEGAWHRWLDEVDSDLAAAAAIVPQLPADSRIAVCAAHDLFAELSGRLRAIPAGAAARRRVRVSTAAKVRIALAAAARHGRPRTRARA